MAVARSHLEALGWTGFKDRHASKPYDFEAIADGERTFIEVKGTSSDGDRVVLTRGEVEHVRANSPNTALVIVHGIELGGSEEAPQAAGGTVTLHHPWTVSPDALTAIAYQYDTPTQSTGTQHRPT